MAQNSPKYKKAPEIRKINKFNQKHCQLLSYTSFQSRNSPPYTIFIKILVAITFMFPKNNKK